MTEVSEAGSVTKLNGIVLITSLVTS